MAISDWNQANANRSYPFIKTSTSREVPYNAILDARFFVINPKTEPVKIWLTEMGTQPSKRVFVFKNSDGNTIRFDVPHSKENQCIWNTDDPELSGYCVFGPYPS